jgi:hypothetical protein
MPETFPASVIHNKATGRYHPVVFYPSPKPSEAGDTVVRHRSKCHHTEGFATMAEACEFITAQPTWRMYDVMWEWDGDGVPVIVFWFPLARGAPEATAPTTIAGSESR